jgi:hypothetical protein
LPQVKISLSVLDPLGLALTTSIASGEKADDPLYLHEIERVRATEEKLAGIYPGNPKRATASPTTEMMLKAFEGIAFSVVESAGQVHRHLTPFTTVRQRLLDLFDSHRAAICRWFREASNSFPLTRTVRLTSLYIRQPHTFLPGRRSRLSKCLPSV